jgi:hypothetical protein
MSAVLLRNNKKCNELEDDRESCLHVLTWKALRFTKHTCSEGDSNMFLRAFDEEYEDSRRCQCKGNPVILRKSLRLAGEIQRNDISGYNT